VEKVMSQSQSNRQIYRNLIIFTVVILGIGWLGAALNSVTEAPDPQQSLGILLWIVAPMATGFLLRAFGGDGWRDAGLKPNLPSGWLWYVVALAIFPLVSLLLFGLGPLVGAFSWAGFSAQGLGTFVSLVAVAFASSFVKNVFEEMAWRGYLTARFDALQLNPFVNHLLTGLIWAGWHLPYWLFIVDVQTFTSLDTATFVVVGMLTLIVTAITYGELRLLSQSVWPAVILHSMANAITATFLLNGFIELQGVRGIVFSPGNDGILHSVLFALIGVGLYQYRKRRTPRA
jgi:membrane protease YdiL (CAAX protease family)